MNLIHSLLKLLKNPSEDEIVKIYCCKSIENITAQAKEVGLKFAQFDTLQVLAGCFNATKNEGFRSSICCTIHHILILNPTLREMFFERVGLPSIIDALNSPDTSSKTQQILLWILLVQFDKSPKSKLTKAIAEDETLLIAVLSLLEVSSSVVKGRVFLYIYFVLEGGLKRSLTLLDSKLFQLI
jgi:serine/threonine-protein kinase ULK4